MVSKYCVQFLVLDGLNCRPTQHSALNVVSILLHLAGCYCKDSLPVTRVAICVYMYLLRVFCILHLQFTLLLLLNANYGLLQVFFRVVALSQKHFAL